MAKTAYILVGPKGSGKTYIGMLMQRRLNIGFLRVENIWLGLKDEMHSKGYVQKGFSLVEKTIDEMLAVAAKITIESTGAHEYFNVFLDSLRKKYNVRLIKVTAPLALCFERIKSRDQSVHIPVSDERAEEINRKAAGVDLAFDLEIENVEKPDEKIIESISGIL
jgi:shikimate kinase